MELTLNHQLTVWTTNEAAAVRRLQGILATSGTMQRHMDRLWQDDERALLQANSRLRLLRAYQMHRESMHA